MKIGDLVEYIGVGDYYTGKKYTIFDIDLNGYVYCLSGHMSFPRCLNMTNLKIIETKSKFSVGSVIVHKLDNKKNGIVIGSNSVGTILRTSILSDQEGYHSIIYVSNRNYKKADS